MRGRANLIIPNCTQVQWGGQNGLVTHHIRAAPHIRLPARKAPHTIANAPAGNQLQTTAMVRARAISAPPSSAKH